MTQTNAYFVYLLLAVLVIEHNIALKSVIAWTITTSASIKSKRNNILSSCSVTSSSNNDCNDINIVQYRTTKHALEQCNDNVQQKEIFQHDTNLRQNSSRRQIFSYGISTIASVASLSVLPSKSSSMTISKSKSLCDPTVSIWKHPTTNRIVYIVGTAHISEISAELAGQLVRDTNPNAVFVELDLKRVARGSDYTKTITMNGENNPNTNAYVIEPTVEKTIGEVDTVGAGPPSNQQLTSTIATPSSSRIVIPNVRGALMQESSTALLATTKALSSASSIVDSDMSDQETSNKLLLAPPPPPLEQPSSSSKSGGIFSGIRQKAMNVATVAVGNAMKGMYKNLGNAGFNPGDEFMTAITEGQKINADIILGDQDVEITLRRLTEALSQTDINLLINTDSEFERSMNEMFPTSSSSSSMIPPTIQQNADDPTQFKKEMTQYIEQMKSRTNLRQIMIQLKEIAPALVQAMLTERDIYMATGIDILNQYESIVAVMGLAHMDGVENNLIQKGWKRFEPKYC